MIISTLIAQSSKVGLNSRMSLAQAIEPEGGGGGGAAPSIFGTGLAPETPATTGLAQFNLASPLDSMELLISRVIGLITVIGSIIFIFMFLYGALKWLSAGGDSGKVEKARDSMVQGVIGLIILIGSYGIVGLIGTAIGIDILNPAAQIRTIFRVGPSAASILDLIGDLIGL